MAYLALAVVGVGSVLFHATLKYEMQLMDEVPMIYSTAVMGYILCEVKKKGFLDLENENYGERRKYYPPRSASRPGAPTGP